MFFPARTVQSCVLSEVIGIAWAVRHVGACAAHMLSKSGVRVFIVVQMHIISRHTHRPILELQIVIFFLSLDPSAEQVSEFGIKMLK